MRKKILVASLLTAMFNQQLQVSAQFLAFSDKSSQDYQKPKNSLRILKNLLSELETKYKVSFIYKSDISNMGLTIKPKLYSSLQAELEGILTPNGLVFQKVRDNFYVVGTKGTNLRSELNLNLIPNEQTSKTYTESNSAKTVLAEITGIVTDENGESLPGVTVTEKGTKNGTVTDVNGRFVLKVSNAATTLTASFIGYMTQDVAINGRVSLNIKLVPSVNDLQGVVVVGYGTQRAREVTGSIVSIKAKDIENNINLNPVTALQGTVSGVQVTQQGGRPGSGVRIRVRGNASMLSGGDPLIIIDGVPALTASFGGGALSGLTQMNPNDIESMEVLKDAAAAAIYGSRAANGVILVTTKKGKAGQTTFNVNYEEGISNVTNRVDLLNGSELLEINEAASFNRRRSGLNAPSGAIKYPYSLPDELNNVNGYDATVAQNTNVNWLDQVLREGVYRDVSLSGSSASEKTSIYGSLSYRNEQPVEIGRNYQIGNARVNAQLKPSEKFNLGANIALALISDNNLGDYFSKAQSSALPIYPIYQPSQPELYFNGFNTFNRNVGTNPLFEMDNFKNTTKTTRNTSTVFAEYTPIAGLALRTEWAYDLQTNFNDQISTRLLFPAAAQNVGARGIGNGQSQTRRFQSNAWNANNTITYGRTFKETHSFTGLIGSSILNTQSQGESIIAEGFAFDYENVLGGTATVLNPSRSQFRFASLFSRFNYNYNKKYFAEVSARIDGSSRFSKENRVAKFGGASLGWAISEENFLKDVSFIDYLKLRASYGSVGNSEVPTDFPYVSTFNLTDSEILYANFNGATFGFLGNRLLGWETTNQANLGLDFNLIKGRVGGSLEVYNKLSKDLLLTTSLSNIVGYINNNFTVNVGSLRNRGIEFALNTVNIQSDAFKWTSDFNISRNVGKVLTLTPRVNAQDTKIKFLDAGRNRLVEGGVFGAYYLPIWAGVDPVTGNELIKEVDQVHLEKTGEARLTGNLIDATLLAASSAGSLNNHRMLISDKSPHPDFIGGFNNRFTYKSFDLSALLYFQVGNYILDEGERLQSYPAQQQSLRTSVKEGNIPPLYESPLRGINTTRFLHDGSFARLRNLQFGYNLPASIAQRLKLKNMRLYVAGQNLFTVTKFKGWDPEVYQSSDNQTGNLGPGTTLYNLPQIKTFLGGLNIGF